MTYDAPRVLLPHRPRLPAPDEVHVWAADLGCLLRHRQALLFCVSPEDLKAAASLRDEALRAGWLCARGMLRCVLDAYLGQPAQSLDFALGAHGKPHLAGALAQRLSFNLSHSGRSVLLAVAHPQLSVGIDVEQCLALPDWLRLAQSCFHPQEALDLAVLHMRSPRLGHRAFYETWTRKEAVLKALGLGLSMPLSAFRVSVGARRPVRLLEWQAPGPVMSAARPDVPAPGHWQLRDVPLGAGYAAALAAVCGAPLRVRRCRFEAQRWPGMSRGERTAHLPRRIQA